MYPTYVGFTWDLISEFLILSFSFWYLDYEYFYFGSFSISWFSINAQIWALYMWEWIWHSLLECLCLFLGTFCFLRLISMPKRISNHWLFLYLILNWLFFPLSIFALGICTRLYILILYFLVLPSSCNSLTFLLFYLCLFLALLSYILYIILQSFELISLNC